MTEELEAFQKKACSDSKSNVGRPLHDAKLGVCLEARNRGALQARLDSAQYVNRGKLTGWGAMRGSESILTMR